ncbi:MAG: helix-turn-helix transcriptional regulator [Azonexus sp.]|jgi:transcriptional regulator with XRE-family HTH domain|nr:helix-turn-helix transcriptional regulator [Azonexus sp.]
MTELIAHFGLTVRSFRERHGWSQELLAEKADLNRSYLGEVERGCVMPSLETAAKLASALGVPLSELLAFCEQRAA